MTYQLLKLSIYFYLYKVTPKLVILIFRTITITVIFILSGYSSGFAQNQKELDSLYALLPTVQDTLKVRVLYSIARFEIDREPEKGLAIAVRSLRKAKEINYIRGMVSAYNQLGAFHNLFHNDFNISKFYLDSAEALASTSDLKIPVFITRAMWHSRKGEFERSHAYFMSALGLMGPKQNNHAYRIYTNIGYNLNNPGRHREAIQYCKRAVRIAEKALSFRDLGVSLANLGGPYMQLNEYDSAFMVYDRLYKIELEHGNPILNPTLLSELGKLYFERGEYDTAYYFMHAGLIKLMQAIINTNAPTAEKI